MDNDLRVEVETWAKQHGVDVAEAVRYLLRTGMGAIIPTSAMKKKRRRRATQIQQVGSTTGTMPESIWRSGL